VQVVCFSTTTALLDFSPRFAELHSMTMQIRYQSSTHPGQNSDILPSVAPPNTVGMYATHPASSDSPYYHYQPSGYANIPGMRKV